MTEDSSGLPPGVMEEVLELIYSGQKIEAVKRYREMRGVSLVESKQFIEQLTAKLKEESPDKFVERPGGFGCIGFVLLLVAASCALTTYAWGVHFR